MAESTEELIEEGGGEAKRIPATPARVLATVFPGESEMAARCRAFDWSSTPLGEVAGWSQSLRTLVSTMLASRHPMFLWWGPALVQIYNDGYLPSFGSSGRDVTALGARGREHWAEIWPVIGPQIESIMSGGPATWHEDQLVPITRNGRLEDVYWTYGYSPVRDDDGGIGGVLVVVQETTVRVQALAERERLLAGERGARAEAEAMRAQAELERGRLRQLFAQAPAFICVLRGPEHVYEVANDAYAQLVGFRELLGRPVREAVPEAEGQGFFELLDQVLATGEAFVGEEVPITLQRTRGAEPEQRYINFVYQPIVEADGARSGIFVHGVDVTDHVLARREAEEARAEAEAASRAKSQFLAVMSHELRTPLNAIGGYAELMEMGIRGPITEEQRDDLRRLQASQRHLLGLINEVLNYTKLETGTVQYVLVPVKVRDALVAAEALVAPQTQAKELALTVESVAPGLVVRADAEKLRQILVNLLSNAMKFTERGGAIALTASAAPDESVVRLAVRDTGIGIAADQLDRIFDPFVQVRSDLARTAEGTGLGLAISRDLARGMGGELSVESTPGVGSTFTLSLPRA